MGRRLHEDVMAILFEAIATNKHQAGERLPSISALAKQFGVSRTVVREALIKLEDRGVIRIRHGSGSFVEPPSGWDPPSV